MSTEVRVASIPNCDACKAAPAVYDSKTIHGPWAYLCEPCWQRLGPGRLGTGYGQRLVLRNH